jgi:hypothetical protein
MTERRTSASVKQRRKADPPRTRRVGEAPKPPGRPDPQTRLRQLQDRYLEGIRQFGTLVHACHLAHVSPHSVYLWRETDDTFVFREKEAQEHLTQALEREALRRAFEGFDRPVFQRGQLVGHERVFSDSLMTTLLKARRPDKYRENINVSGSVEQIVREVRGFDPTEVL